MALETSLNRRMRWAQLLPALRAVATSALLLGLLVASQHIAPRLYEAGAVDQARNAARHSQSVAPRWLLLLKLGRRWPLEGLDPARGTGSESSLPTQIRSECGGD